MLGNKTRINDFEGIDTIQSMFSDHDEINVDSKNKEEFKISPQYLIIKQQLDNSWVKEEITNILEWVIMKATCQDTQDITKIQLIQKTRKV